MTAVQLKNLLGKILIFIIFPSILLSAIYNSAYFWAISIPLSNVPLSPMDFVNTAVMGALPVIFILLILGFMVLLFIRLKKGMAQEEIIPSKENPEKMQKFRRGYGVFLKYPAIIYSSIGRGLSNYFPINEQEKNLVKVLIIFSPIMISFFFKGYIDSLSSVTKKNFNTIVYTKTDREIHGVLLRYLVKGVLIKSFNNNDAIQENIVFIPWEEIKGMRLRLS